MATVNLTTVNEKVSAKLVALFDEYAEKVCSEYTEHEHLQSLVDERTHLQARIDLSRKKIKRLGERLNVIEGLQAAA